MKKQESEVKLREAVKEFLGKGESVDSKPNDETGHLPCPVCDGQGWYACHNINFPNEPDRVQCRTCSATGSVPGSGVGTVAAPSDSVREQKLSAIRNALASVDSALKEKDLV